MLRTFETLNDMKSTYKYEGYKAMQKETASNPFPIILKMSLVSGFTLSYIKVNCTWEESRMANKAPKRVVHMNVRCVNSMGHVRGVRKYLQKI